jgi:hypothetical protein
LQFETEISILKLHRLAKSPTQIARVNETLANFELLQFPDGLARQRHPELQILPRKHRRKQRTRRGDDQSGKLYPPKPVVFIGEGVKAYEVFPFC